MFQNSCHVESEYGMLKYMGIYLWYIGRPLLSLAHFHVTVEHPFLNVVPHFTCASYWYNIHKYGTAHSKCGTWKVIEFSAGYIKTNILASPSLSLCGWESVRGAWSLHRYWCALYPCQWVGVARTTLRRTVTSCYAPPINKSWLFTSVLKSHRSISCMLTVCRIPFWWRACQSRECHRHNSLAPCHCMKCEDHGLQLSVKCLLLWCCKYLLGRLNLRCLVQRKVWHIIYNEYECRTRHLSSDVFEELTCRPFCHMRYFYRLQL